MENLGENPMGTENQNNRSTAMTPEVLALVNATTTAAVKEAIAGMSGMMAQVMKEMALTPEKLREATRPYVDPAKEKRDLREKMKFKTEEIENAKALRLRRETCPHRYKNGLAAIGVIRNFHDRQPRGVCMLCHEFFTPREWVIDAPTEEHPEGVARISPAHPKYQLVYDAINQKES